MLSRGGYVYICRVCVVLHMTDYASDPVERWRYIQCIYKKYYFYSLHVIECTVESSVRVHQSYIRPISSYDSQSRDPSRGGDTVYIELLLIIVI